MLRLDNRLVPNFVSKQLCLLRDNVTMCLGIVQCTEGGFTKDFLIEGRLFLWAFAVVLVSLYRPPFIIFQLFQSEFCQFSVNLEFM